MLRVALCLSFALLACHGSDSPRSDPCLAITERYAAALPAAMACDPAGPDPCTVGRPVVKALQDPDGTIHPEALCLAPCFHSVNANGVAALDDLLAQYDAAGCAYAACWCQPLPVRCDVSGMCYGLIPA